MGTPFRWGLVVVAAAVVLAAGRHERAHASRTRVDPVVELGRRLFFDPSVSRSGDNSCASCHDPAFAFSTPRRLDVDDFSLTRRRSQTLLDVAQGKRFHWDGEFDSVEDLVTARLTSTTAYYGVATPLTPRTPNAGGSFTPPTRGDPPPLPAPGEEGAAALASAFELAAQALSSFDDAARAGTIDVAGTVEQHGRYAEAFRAAFGSQEVTVPRIAKAVAAYVATIRSGESDYDRFVAGDESALSTSARRGLELFTGRAGCATCHLVEGRRAAFTDHEFHNTGVSARSDTRLGRSPTLTRRLLVSGLGLPVDSPVLPEAVFGGFDDGRFALTGLPGHRGAFKTPTLRDVAVRTPYMHDGSFETLESVVRHYARGGFANAELAHRLQAFDASDTDVADLVAFLHGLTSDLPAALAPEYGRRTRRIAFRVVDPAGRPLAGFPLHVAPVGDRLPGDGTVASRPTDVVTDAQGRVSLAPSRRTHVHVGVPSDVTVAGGAWVPDTCADVTLVVSAVGRATLLLAYPEGVEPAASLRAFAESRSFSADERDRLRTTNPAVLDALRTAATTFVRTGRSDGAGRAYVRYEAWINAGAPAVAHVDVPLPERRVTVPVALANGRETRHELQRRTR